MMREIDTISLLSVVKTAYRSGISQSIKLSDHAVIRTFNGSKIARDSEYGVGKLVGSRLYFHISYAEDVIPSDVYEIAQKRLREYTDRTDFNCVRYDLATQEVCFQQGIRFDIDDEPVVGEYVRIYPQEKGFIMGGFSPAVWHHKWLWVRDDYAGFDVQIAKERSAYLCEHIKETMIGGSARAWSEQRRKWGIL